MKKANQEQKPDGIESGGDGSRNPAASVKREEFAEIAVTASQADTAQGEDAGETQKSFRTAEVNGLRLGIWILWACFVACSLVFLFVKTFTYSVSDLQVEALSAFRVTGLYSKEGAAIGEQSALTGQKTLFGVISWLYAAAAIIAVGYSLSNAQSIGYCGKDVRRGLMRMILFQTALSLIGMILYILACDRFFKDLGARLGTFGPLPYIYFAVNAVLSILSALLYGMPEAEGAAIWRPLKGKVQIVANIVLSVAVSVGIVLLYLLYPIFLTESGTYSLWQAATLSSLWGEDPSGGQVFARILCFLGIAALLVCAGLIVVWINNRANFQDGKWTEKKLDRIIGVMIIPGGLTIVLSFWIKDSLPGNSFSPTFLLMYVVEILVIHFFILIFMIACISVLNCKN